MKEKNLSDLPSPSNRTIIRSLLIEQFSIEHRTIEFRRNVCEINKGFDPKDIIVAILPSGAVQILFIDLVRKTAKQYAELIESFLSDERFHGQKIYIRFLSYTNARKKTLFKVLQETPVTTLVSLNQSRLKIGGKCYDLLYYFDNTEPLL
ncbi:hypothetical protein DFR59_11150 [Falsibacillus pallidus]|uniref:Uncharacterized protein n=1 Tax=Falsibacillus pallidus TaxID=493781 RepID=A0A370GB23_9BACI|nr:hypothetical protein DFR59_11150 [Falsibacillus pallidus]